jgi:hypothetical protein
MAQTRLWLVFMGGSSAGRRWTSRCAVAKAAGADVHLIFWATALMFPALKAQGTVQLGWPDAVIFHGFHGDDLRAGAGRLMR